MPWNPDLRDEAGRTNGERAEIAWSCLEHGKYSPANEKADAVSDLIGDLLHLSDREGYDVLDIWSQANIHHNYEADPAHHVPLRGQARGRR